MRESIGGLSLFQIVIVFLLLFTAIMCFTISHSRAIAVKDEVVSIIENSSIPVGGTLNPDTLEAIRDRLSEVGHRSVGDCDADGTGDWVGYDRNLNQNNTNALFCIKLTSVSEQFVKDAQNQCQSPCEIVSPENGTDYPNMYYYNVKLFYTLDVPVVERMNFNIVSSTKVITLNGTKVRKWS